MNFQLITLSCLVCLSFFHTTAFANDASSSKEKYNLFNPTPRDEMRGVVTDRPDKTESAYTIDAGHFAHETDIINIAFDNDGGTDLVSALVMAPNLKVGLTNRVDLQLIVESYNYVSEKADGSRSKQSGFGDILTRLKINIWGNDGGQTALALMPYLKFPTNRGDLGNSSLEGGLIAPFALDITETFGIGLMSQLDVVLDEDASGYHPEFVNSATFGQDLTDEIAVYAEAWTSLSEERPIILTADFGLTYSPNEDIQFDIGMNVGVTDNADDFNPFIGISQRF